jgi:multidrug efflux pump subunit AcrA (membrane-fusion protein)
MLPISANKIPLNPANYSSLRDKGAAFPYQKLSYILTFLAVCFTIFLFLPWTQTVNSKGKITTLSANLRPQSIHSVLGGSIEKWYVREGQTVKKGDTIAFISEIKTDYFDPNIAERSDFQRKAKEATAKSYQEKVGALDRQISILDNILRLKIEQTQNKVKQTVLKVQSDSIDLENAKINYTIAKQQYDRQLELYQKGLKSLVELEQRELKLQETLAKRNAQENKLLATRNELLNIKIDLDGLRNENIEKVAKSQSDRFSALSNLYDAQGSISKLETQAINYAMRAGMYYILAPQDGYITKLYKTGIREIVKEGDELLIFTPYNPDFAVDMYVSPIDAPLLHTNQDVRIVFDGWPAFVVSGWQSANTGTFAGKVIAVDKLLNEDGKFRVLIVPNKNERPWPKNLGLGGGAQVLALLNDVPIWYEFWRQFNGFPPDFYTDEEKTDKVKIKTPIKRIK